MDYGRPSWGLEKQIICAKKQAMDVGTTNARNQEKSSYRPSPMLCCHLEPPQKSRFGRFKTWQRLCGQPFSQTLLVPKYLTQSSGWGRAYSAASLCVSAVVQIGRAWRELAALLALGFERLPLAPQPLKLRAQQGLVAPPYFPGPGPGLLRSSLAG